MPVLTDLDPINLRENCRFDLPNFLNEFFDRSVADLLASDTTIGGDSEQDAATAMVEHRAH